MGNRGGSKEEERGRGLDRALQAEGPSEPALYPPSAPALVAMKLGQRRHVGR